MSAVSSKFAIVSWCLLILYLKHRFNNALIVLIKLTPIKPADAGTAYVIRRTIEASCILLSSLSDEPWCLNIVSKYVLWEHDDKIKLTRAVKQKQPTNITPNSLHSETCSILTAGQGKQTSMIKPAKYKLCFNQIDVCLIIRSPPINIKDVIFYSVKLWNEQILRHWLI